MGFALRLGIDIRPNRVYPKLPNNANLSGVTLSGFSITNRKNKCRAAITPMPATPHRFSKHQLPNRPVRFLPAAMLLLSREKTMLSEKQLAANRANAQLSTGPKTKKANENPV